METDTLVYLELVLIGLVDVCLFAIFFLGPHSSAFSANRFLFLQQTCNFASLSLFIICYIGDLNLNWWVPIRCLIFLLFAIAVSYFPSTQPLFDSLFRGISFICVWLLWLFAIVCPILFAIAPLTDAINYPKEVEKFKLLSFCWQCVPSQLRAKSALAK